MLSIERLNVEIQGSQILRCVSLEVRRGELVCLVGRNGAGKTTTLRTVMGFLPPASGAITYKDQTLVGLSTLQIARMGIGFAPEDSQVFADLTVTENIELPTWTRTTSTPKEIRIRRAFELFPSLKRYAARGGANLSGGERRMLSIARTITLDAELYLLDEPFEGLSPVLIPSISASIGLMRDSGSTILITESEIHHVPEQVDRLYVIERGEIVFSGTIEELRADRTVRSVFGHGL